MICIGGGAIGERHTTVGTRSSHWLLLEVTYCDWLYSVVTVEFYFNVNWHNFVPFLLFLFIAWQRPGASRFVIAVGEHHRWHHRSVFSSTQ